MTLTLTSTPRHHPLHERVQLRIDGAGWGERNRGLTRTPGPLLMHLHTGYMAYSECLPTRLNPLVAERTCFSQVVVPDGVGLQGGGSSGSDEFKFRPQVKICQKLAQKLGQPQPVIADVLP